jgi:hypothetical protein
MIGAASARVKIRRAGHRDSRSRTFVTCLYAARFAARLGVVSVGILTMEETASGHAGAGLPSRRLGYGGIRRQTVTVMIREYIETAPDTVGGV